VASALARRLRAETELTVRAVKGTVAAWRRGRQERQEQRDDMGPDPVTVARITLDPAHQRRVILVAGCSAAVAAVVAVAVFGAVVGTPKLPRPPAITDRLGDAGGILAGGEPPAAQANPRAKSQGGAANWDDRAPVASATPRPSSPSVQAPVPVPAPAPGEAVAGAFEVGGARPAAPPPVTWPTERPTEWPTPTATATPTAPPSPSPSVTEQPTEPTPTEKPTPDPSP